MDIKIKIVSKDDDFMEYVINSDKNVIHYSDLQKYWSYANAIDQESVRVYVQGEWIVGIMLTANAQGGIIFIWDCKQKKLIHISNGSYTYSVLVYDNTVYGLSVVSNFVTPAHFELTKCKLNTMDVQLEPKTVDCKFTCDVDDFDGDFDKIHLLNNGGQFVVELDNKKYPIELV